MSMPAGEGAPSGTPGTPSGPASTGTPDPQTGVNPGVTAPSGTEPQTPPERVPTQAEYDAIKNQLRAADQRRDAAEKDAKALRDAQLSEEEKRKRDLAEAQAELAKRDEAVKQLKLENAFVTDNTYDWHDPKTALKVADLSGVTIDDAGKVTGLKEALKATAESNPWMVKPKDGVTAPSGGAPAGSTGVGSSAGANASGVSRTDLEKKFPALRGRAT